MLQTETRIETYVDLAIDGDKTALNRLVEVLQYDIYYLALRMLAHPDDARDASQEILIRIVTKLSTFQGQSAFKTWAYRVAVNYLISEKKGLSRYPNLNFDDYQADLESDLEPPSRLLDQPDYHLMLDELRVSCTMAMLLCLSPTLRMAYILGDVLEMEQQQASFVLGVSSAAYRKQLSRARSKVVSFTERACGLVSNTAKCRCETKLTGAVARQRINVKNLHYATEDPKNYETVKASIRDTQSELRALKLQTSIQVSPNVDALSEVLACLDVSH